MTAVTAPDPQRRRSVRLALIHALIAIAFMVAFIWVQAHR